MKIPYGLSNFATVIKDHYYYVDKTAFIETLENEGRNLILLRPRRFGKSLFLSMLSYYYDVNYTSDFDALFGHLAIGNQPTSSRNQYQVLKFDFSGIQTDNPESVQQGFNDSISAGMVSLFNRYHYPQSATKHLLSVDTAAGRAKYFLNEIEKAEQKVYLLIDEYDHFANALLAEDLSHFKTIMGKGGFVRAFYEVFKIGTQQGLIDRIFITGVTPIMLDSLTSGFNIVENISTKPAFSEAIGFNRYEAEALIHPLTKPCNLALGDIMPSVTHWYNGYRFEQDSPSVFNADMLLYFAKHFNQNTGEYPAQMLDENIASDYGKILAMFSIGDRDSNYMVLDELISKGEVVAKQRRKFDFDKGFDRHDFVSLLYYMGFITYKSVLLGRESYQIPNYVIKVLYFEYFKIELERINSLKISDRHIEDAIIALALENDPNPLLTEVEAILMQFSNRDFMQFDEKHLKTRLLTLLFQSPVYMIKSETEINHKYPDILLLERSPYAIKHEHLIELKYCKKSARKKDASAWNTKLQEGIKQVEGYLQLPDIKPLNKLSAWVILTDGEEVLIREVC